MNYKKIVVLLSIIIYTTIDAWRGHSYRKSTTSSSNNNNNNTFVIPKGAKPIPGYPTDAGYLDEEGVMHLDPNKVDLGGTTAEL